MTCVHFLKSSLNSDTRKQKLRNVAPVIVLASLRLLSLESQVMGFMVSLAKKLRGKAGTESQWQNPGYYCSFVVFEEKNLKALQCLPHVSSLWEGNNYAEKLDQNKIPLSVT